MGAVTGSGSNVGGLVGLNNNSNSLIANSYAAGAVNGGSNVGGLIGNFNGGLIRFIYATGRVTGSGSLGGLIGAFSSGVRISSNYWDITSSGVTSGLGTGRTTEQLITPTAPTATVNEQHVYNGWSTSSWDFGTARQYPAVKYTRGPDDDNPACGVPSRPRCGELLPGQRPLDPIADQRILEGTTVAIVVILNTADANP